MATPHGDHGHDKPTSPLVQMMVSMSGAAAPEHETEPPGVAPVSVQAGHEPDKYEVRGILYVPAIVAVTLVLAYILVTVLFNTIRHPNENVHTDPQVKAEYTTPEFNNRAGRIDTWDPKQLKDKPDTVVPQPRLEGIRIQAGGGPSDPPYYRSKRSMQEGNPPEIRPEDLRAENYVDPASGQKVLAEYAPIKVEGQGERVRVPINDAIEMVAHGQLKGLPVKKDAKPLPTTTDELPKQSNSGRGTPTAAPKAEVKKDPHEEKKH